MISNQSRDEAISSTFSLSGDEHRIGDPRRAGWRRRSNSGRCLLELDEALDDVLEVAQLVGRLERQS